MTTPHHLRAVLDGKRFAPDRDAILADADWRDALCRRIRTEAERDATRRRQFMDRIRADGAAMDAVRARFATDRDAIRRGLETVRLLLDRSAAERAVAAVRAHLSPLAPLPPADARRLFA